MKRLISSLIIFFFVIFQLNDGFCLPEGENTDDDVDFDRSEPGILSITTHDPKAVIEWSAFNIDENQSVHFYMPSETSEVLNNVSGGIASYINGGILAEQGYVYIVNPSGITFGPEADIDVGGLIASVFSISNEDFLAGSYDFEKLKHETVEIVNQGSINAEDFVIMLADSVKNENSIEVEHGSVDADFARSLIGNIVNNEEIVAAGTVTDGIDGTIILLAGGEDIDVDGTLSAPEGKVYLWTCGTLDVREANIISRDGGYIYNPLDQILVSWVGGSGNDWAVDANWSGGLAPITADFEVTISREEGASVVTGTDYTIGALKIGGEENTCSLTLGGDLIIDDSHGTTGDLEFDTNSIVNAEGYTISLDGDWDPYPSQDTIFNAGASKVIFDGIDQNIKGSNTFYDLEKTTPGSIKFEAGETQLITGMLTLKGADENSRVILESSVDGEPWNIEITTDTYDLAYLDITDCVNLGEVIYSDTSIITGSTGWDTSLVIDTTKMLDISKIIAEVYKYNNLISYPEHILRPGPQADISGYEPENMHNLTVAPYLR